MSLKGADDIFSTEESRQEQQREQVQQIPIGELFPFKNHPFKVLDDESMQRTVESVEQYGVLSPLIARPRPEGGYEIISGHRRQHAAQLAGLDTLPVIVRNMDDDAAVLLMVDSNLQRENILPSERAFAYKMKLKALKNQGARSDLTSPQVAAKFRSDDAVAKDQGISGDTVRRYIRLTNLMSKKNLSKLLALYLPYVVIGLLATNLGEAWRLAVGKELGDKIVSLMDTLPAAFSNPLPSLHPFDLFIGLCCGAGMRLAVYLKGKNAKKYRHGMEYGSARWGTPKDIEPFMAPKFADNIILTKTERLMMSNRPPDPKNARNKNVLVVGGSGSGKTRFWLKPNLLQCHSSYVVTDPKGSIVVECGNALLQKGYKLKIFNTINFSKSMRYNPMAYIHSEKDILKLVTALMTNTKGEGQGGDPFWDKAERLLLVSLIAYLHYEAPVEEQNFATLLEMLNTMQVSEDDETYQNPVDLLFEDLGKKKPKSFAVRQYKLYKLAAGKTAKSILISCGARLAPFDIQEVRDATMYDELELDKLGDRKTALFLIMSDTDSTFNFLISMIYTQLFNLLCDKADDQYGGKLPVHVRCLIDECANIGQIPQLEKLVATIRSREISACLVLQTRSQLKAIYKDNADTIVGNMDSQIFLGGSEPTTLKDLAEALGKETIDSYNNSDTRGNSPSYGTNYQKLGHELMSRDELAVLDGGKCILQLRGVRPFLSDKYDLTQHPNYKYTSDYDPKNALDIEKFLNRKEKIHPDDTFIMVDADSLPLA